MRGGCGAGHESSVGANLTVVWWVWLVGAPGAQGARAQNYCCACGCGAGTANL